MGANKDKIFEKLRKLMNLKESSKELGNDGEANAAAAGITRLLMYYNLSETDVPEQEKIDNPVISTEIPFKVELSNGAWYRDLVTVVCKHNMCRALIVSIRYNGRMRRSKFEIIGRKKNVEAVLYLISFLSHQFVAIGKREYSQYRHDCIWKHNTYPQSLTMYLKSFLYGCCIGLNKKLEEEKMSLSAETNVNALILTTQSEIDDFLKGEEIGKARKSNASIDALCAKKGVEAGKAIEINKGIHAKVVSEDLRLI